MIYSIWEQVGADFRAEMFNVLNHLSSFTWNFRGGYGNGRSEGDGVLPCESTSDRYRYGVPLPYFLRKVFILLLLAWYFHAAS